MVALFTTLGENIPIFKRVKTLEPRTEGFVSRMHYRWTCLLIMAMCLMVTCPEWIGAEGTYIDCMHGNSIPDGVINNYCWIKGTFSVPRHYENEDKVGWDVSQVGVGPYNPAKESHDIEVKAYYQWVPFVLFLQGLMFYIPHLMYKALEDGKMKNLIGALSRFQLCKEKRCDGASTLAKYLAETRGEYNGYSIRIFLGHSLYLVNVIGQIFFTNYFLGHNFFDYGHLAFMTFFETQGDGEASVMSRVFPRVTKCTFHKYGPSGNIQRHDAQCILPINIINEKIYVFLWFWFILLTVLTSLDLIHHFCLIWFESVRLVILKRKLRRSPKYKVEKLHIDIPLICRHLEHGDWILYYHLLRNMDSITYAEWLAALTETFADVEERDVKKERPEALPLLPQMADRMSTLIM